MDVESNETMHDEGEGPASTPTTLPAPPRMPTFMPRIVSAVEPTLRLVCSNTLPQPSRMTTVPRLRVVCPSTPPTPPTIPPTGSTPIRRAA